MIKNLVVDLGIDNHANTTNLDHIAYMTLSMRARLVLFWR
jgi:hypothetical protein